MKTSQIVYLGELRTEAVHMLSGKKITTDAPPDNQGKGEFFSPTDLLATSLGSCMLTIMGITARAHNFSIVGTKVDISKIMGTEPRRVIEIVVGFSFPSIELTTKQRKLLEAAARECPVAKSLNTELKQTVVFNYS